MKSLLWVILILFLFQPGHSQVIINEFVSSNSATIHDEYGDYDDWIELYNPNSVEENIKGLVLRNSIHIWQVPDGGKATLVPAAGYIIIWADHEENTGPLHANFRLSTGETLILCKPDSVTIIDSLIVPDMAENSSYGRCSDGNWQVFEIPSPGAKNNCKSTSIALNKTNDFVIYPNITHNNIYIKIPDCVTGNITVKLISIIGTPVFEQSFDTHEFIINLAAYNNGLYILILSSKNSHWKERIVKAD